MQVFFVVLCLRHRTDVISICWPTACSFVCVNTPRWHVDVWCICFKCTVKARWISGFNCNWCQTIAKIESEVADTFYCGWNINRRQIIAVIKRAASDGCYAVWYAHWLQPWIRKHSRRDCSKFICFKYYLIDISLWKSTISNWCNILWDCNAWKSLRLFKCVRPYRCDPVRNGDFRKMGAMCKGIITNVQQVFRQFYWGNLSGPTFCQANWSFFEKYFFIFTLAKKKGGG